MIAGCAPTYDFLRSCTSQAHAECDVGEKRPVLQQPRLPLKPLHAHRRPGPRETLGQGIGHQNTKQKDHGTDGEETRRFMYLNMEKRDIIDMTRSKEFSGIVNVVD